MSGTHKGNPVVTLGLHNPKFLQPTDQVIESKQRSSELGVQRASMYYSHLPLP